MVTNSSTGPMATNSSVDQSAIDAVNAVSLSVSAVGLAGCTYALATFVLFRNYRLQGRRIAMLVLTSDLLTAAAFVTTTAGNRAGGFLRGDTMTVGKCFAYGFEFGSQYVSGISMFIMVLAMNFTVVLDRGEINQKVEAAAYVVTGFIFVAVMVSNSFECVALCIGPRESTQGPCYRAAGRWNEGYTAVVAAVMVAYIIAVARIFQRRREIKQILSAAVSAVVIDEHGGLVLNTRTKAETIRCKRIASTKREALRDAIEVYVPYTFGFVVMATGVFRLGILLDESADGAQNFLAQTWMALLCGTQPLLNFLATLVQGELRSQLNPCNFWRRLCKRLRCCCSCCVRRQVKTVSVGMTEPLVTADSIPWHANDDDSEGAATDDSDGYELSGKSARSELTHDDVLGYSADAAGQRCGTGGLHLAHLDR